MNGAEWWEYLLRGAGGLAAAAALFVVAKWRYARRDDDHGPADLGLD